MSRIAHLPPNPLAQAISQAQSHVLSVAHGPLGHPESMKRPTTSYGSRRSEAQARSVFKAVLLSACAMPFCVCLYGMAGEQDGAGIVVPHPEQFWPILLADYDVDGYEVWNPQSMQYTEFLIDVIHRKNCRQGLSHRRVLAFMGDDTHMGEKVRRRDLLDPAKAGREIGYQPAWEDVEIQKGLIHAGMDRLSVITEYRQRLSG